MKKAKGKKEKMPAWAAEGPWWSELLPSRLAPVDNFPTLPESSGSNHNQRARSELPQELGWRVQGLAIDPSSGRRLILGQSALFIGANNGPRERRK